MNKEDILIKNAWVFGTACDSHVEDVYSAMDEWAKVVAVAFAEWTEEHWLYFQSGVYKEKDTGQPATLTTSELYNLYKQTIKP